MANADLTSEEDTGEVNFSKTKNSILTYSGEQLEIATLIILNAFDGLHIEMEIDGRVIMSFN